MRYSCTFDADTRPDVPLHVGDCPMANDPPGGSCVCEHHENQERGYVEGGGGLLEFSERVTWRFYVEADDLPGAMAAAVERFVGERLQDGALGFSVRMASLKTRVEER